MLIAYLDEFGHIGPYISPDHPKYNTHPVFGYAGFVVPSSNARKFGAFFQYIKTNLLDFEIQRDNAHPERWEKKGAALFTTKNVQKYPDLTESFNRLLSRLSKLGGRILFYGQQKPVGSAKETEESAKERSAYALRQVLSRLSMYADNRNENVMVILDSVDDEARDEAVKTMASFIYASSSPSELRRIVEVPMQVESHLYGTIQFADWLCALLARMAHYEFEKNSEFSWAPNKFGKKIERSCTSESKIRPLERDAVQIHAKHLCDNNKFEDRRNSKKEDREKRIHMFQTVASACPALAEFRDQLEE